MNKIYAVKSLFESVTTNISPEKFLKKELFFLKLGMKEVNNLLSNNFPTDTFSNSAGGYTTNRLVKILDIFKIMDNLEESLNFKEVYSRFLLFEQGTTTERAIEKYSLDK